MQYLYFPFHMPPLESNLEKMYKISPFPTLSYFKKWTVIVNRGNFPPVNRRKLQSQIGTHWYKARREGTRRRGISPTFFFIPSLEIGFKL